MKAALEAELKTTQKAMAMTQWIGATGHILLGLGLYGIFTGEAAFHPFLSDPIHCYALLSIGGMIALWEGLRIIKLARHKQKLKNQLQQLSEPNRD
ncbi:hypothetical protein [Shewanella litorisediminis]|uniref:Uncharacterized protein n=1 Tax=Shewanella litorisediminis TaxID=1173586 RepID=A0ABX7G1X5_9GAMM|nr:hypothetical protein [Shewanella litorisediminis]MCL2918497.1 hypothetical protein [Shewanella litorisediminis]QRH01329.1 hypothetical protein JQC75_15965 [Shewanella litorisediminis]